MPSNIVLVTGVAGDVGGKLLARLGTNSAFERVIGVDTAPPAKDVLQRMGSAEFVRADIRNPLIAKVISSAGVDTVVHTACLTHPAGPSRRSAVKELNVIGTMRLLAACQSSPKVRKLVVKSTAAVYGAGARSQAVFTEDSELIPASSTGYAKDAVEVEGYVRGFARRRPDITVTLARFANVIGPEVDTVLSRYFALPVVPTVFGYDARLQLLHASDALGVLEQAVLQDKPGVFNVASEGVLGLSQAIRRAGRVGLPMPSAVVPSVGKVLRGARVVDFSADQVRLLNFGRVVDITKLKKEFGYQPRFTTREAFDDYTTGRGLRPVFDGARLASLAGKVLVAAATGQAGR
ncbi:NAD-dependent epimerase/dehydratase family protein [Amycolatopsis sp. DSM 110486]|uniref:NAD-dependent epimerase/dehydratase family protein n=1 Tax=Amycolatopsis sp. DSM 110486 TaxID=2865832 RepID=UPI001C6943E6|nr:NAD-dependent epimerase/dehydratase family protein [Amycolatopsis sp. DSM 110486]QYN24702.1 NAD-dependent epimerase/dehydratase family protein [Amycolatopsis sp. DSM 110486]